MKTEHDQASIALFLDLCAQNEQLCAELYHYYSDLFRENAEVSRLWKKAALEEENHQKQFELAYRLREECEFELTDDFQRALDIHHKLTRLLSHVRQEPPEIQTALQKAIEMEEAIAGLHMGCAVKIKDANTQKMFNAMFDADQGHVDALNQMMTIMKLPQTEMVP